jgi:hypothetical protein
MDVLIREFLIQKLRRSLYKVHHCIGQLNQHQPLEKPLNGSESILSILFHARAGLDRWGMAPFGKALLPLKKNKEWLIPEGYDVFMVVELLEKTVDGVIEKLKKASAEDFSEIKKLGTIRCTWGMGMLNATTHFEAHACQIMMMSRHILGASWIPDPSSITDPYGGW